MGIISSVSSGDVKLYFYRPITTKSGNTRHETWLYDTNRLDTPILNIYSSDFDELKNTKGEAYYWNGSFRANTVPTYTEWDDLTDEFKAYYVLKKITAGEETSTLLGVSVTVDPSVEDYEFLIGNSRLLLSNSLPLNLNRSDSIEKLITDAIIAISEKEEQIEEHQIAFYNTFIDLVSDDAKKEFRVKLAKQSGDTDFIAEEFGIENFFALDRFQDLIDEKIKDYIDTNLNSEFNFLTNTFNQNLNGDKPKASNLLQVKVASDGYLVDPIGTINNNEELFIPVGKTNTPPALELTEIAGTLPSSTRPSGQKGREKIDFNSIKSSEIYENPTSYDKMEFYNRVGNDITYFLVYPEYLKDYYRPEEKSSGLLPWIYDYFTNNDEFISGIDDIILGQWLYFISTIEEDIRDDSQIRESIGTTFNKRAEEIFLFLFNWIVIFRENSIRYNLAKLIEQEEVEELRDPSLDALAIAETAADLNLQGLQGDLDQEELTEEDIKKRTQLYKQCVLLLNSKDLSDDHLSILKGINGNHEMHKNSYYNNRFYMVESSGDNLSIKNKLISPSGSKIKPFMEITPDIASALRPRLRIYKVYQVRDEGDSTKKRTVSFEFPFPSHTNTDRVNQFIGQEIDRGDGLGIKSFNFSFDGETPATSQQYISADLSLFFQTFSDFVKEREVPGGRSDNQDEKFRYVDLFVNTKNCPPDLSSTSPLNYDPQYYRIRVDVGWEPREDSGFEQILKNRGLNSTQFNEALAVMNKSFYLNLIDHEINISDSGTVTISANYIAYIEGIMENNNVLLSEEAKQLQDEFVGKYEAERRKKNCDKFELAELRASINAIRISSRNILHQSLVEKLVKNNCMYFTEVESQDRKDFTTRKFFAKKPDLIKRSTVAYRSQLSQGITGNALTTATNIVLNNNSTTTENYNYIMNEFLSNPRQNNLERVSFFYLADLVYFLLDPIYVNGEPEEQIKVILSSFTIDIPHTGDVSLNLGQIPIEIEVFTKWYKDEIIDKELDSISFLEFIKRLAFYLITDILAEVCIDEQQHKRFSFMNAAINSIKQGEQGIMQRILDDSEPITDVRGLYNSGYLPLPTSALNQERLKPSDFVQYLLIYPHHRPETHVGRAMALEDARRGVHHLYIGANKGILKNASFSKTDIQYLRESRMLTQGENGLLQLSSLYRANLKMIGNTIFYPGMLLYLNPFGFGGMDFGLPHQGPGTTEDPNLSNIMGIGGYQKVVKVSSTISESGKFETDVECIFEHTGEPPREDAEDQARSPGQRSGSDQQNIRKITCTELDKVDAQASTCNPTNISKDLQNQLLNLNRTGTIDKKGKTE